MKGKRPIIQSAVLLMLLPWLSISQTPEALLNIINSESQPERKQVHIDSFLRVNKDSIPLPQLADCYHKLGSKWYYKNWTQSGKKVDLKKAIQYTEEAIHLKKHIEHPKDCSLNQTLYNLGYFHFLNDRIHNSIETYNEIVKTRHQYCDDKDHVDELLPWTLRDLGGLYLITGDYYRSIDSYKKLITFVKNKDLLLPNDYQFLISAHLQLADLYVQIDAIGNLELIKKHLGLAKDYLIESELPCCQYQVDINQQYGNVLWDVENYSEALKYHTKALKFLPLKDSLNLAIVNNSLGTSYLILKKDSLALESFRRAIAYDPNYPDPFNNLGDFYIKKLDFEKAMKNYQRAIDLIIGRDIVFSLDSTLTIEALEFVPDKIPLLNHIVTKANGWINYYEHNNNKEHLFQALKTFTLADQLVDLIRFESTEYQSKLFWREQGSSLYMKAVEVCHLLHKHEEAFYFMERNKALLLLEDLTNEEAKEIAQLPDEAAEREFNLKRSIFLSENDLQEANNERNKAIITLKDSIRENKYRYEQFVDSLNESYPEYAKFKNKAAVLAFEDLKTNYVSGNKAVLHYILNEEQGYGLLTLPDTTLLFPMKDVPKLNKNVETLIATLSDGVSDMGKFQKISNTVFGQLMPEKIYRKIKGKQLLIIPDYILQRIPFEAFVVNTDEKPEYLIENVEIGYAYSASLLEQTQHTERSPAKDFVSFAPIQFTDPGLAELHFSEKEITGIADVYPGETMINGQATKANFLKNVGGHRIVHLATHSDIGDGENPWIAFSDSKMYLKEIYATRNQADMVVLSGCNTSNGELKRGEGVMSLARGFFYSGAKSVVSSLWPIEDETGKDILIDFYKNLDRGDSKSKALQNAKLDYLATVSEEELKHPFYWAGFIVVGDNAPLSDGNYGYWILLAVGLAVVVLFIFRHRLFKLFQ